MRLKVLIVPFFVIMVLVISISYIQPRFVVLEAQKIELAKQSDQVAKIEAVVNNIGKLNQSLDEKKELKKFMELYLPKGIGQGRVIDALNYLASQSGLSVVAMAMEEPAKIAAVAVEPIINPVTGLPIIESTYKNPEAETYIASVEVRGSYENIKAFFNNVSHMDRFQKISDFSIELPDDAKLAAMTQDGAASPTTGELVGTFEARFDYFPERVVQTALDVPIFSQSEFDFSVLQAAFDRVTNPVMELNYIPVGKPNPFQ